MQPSAQPGQASVQLVTQAAAEPVQPAGQQVKPVQPAAQQVEPAERQCHPVQPQVKSTQPVSGEGGQEHQYLQLKLQEMRALKLLKQEALQQAQQEHDVANSSITAEVKPQQITHWTRVAQECQRQLDVLAQAMPALQNQMQPRVEQMQPSAQPEQRRYSW